MPQAAITVVIKYSYVADDWSYRVTMPQAAITVVINYPGFKEIIDGCYNAASSNHSSN